MRLVAKIRNKFAHEFTIRTFDDPDVAELVDGIQHT